MIWSACEDDAMSRSRVFEWHKLFRKEGRELVEEDQRPGHPSTVKNNENLVKVENLWTLTADECTDDIWTLKFSKNYYTENLEMRKICTKLVPKVLIDERIDKIKKICQKFLNCVRDDLNFPQFIRDESWFLRTTQNVKVRNDIPPSHLTSRRPGLANRK